MKEKAKKENNRDEIFVRKPSFFLYSIPVRIMKVFARFYWNLHIDNKEIKGMKEPTLAIAPHASTLDVLPTLCTLLPRRFNIVAAKDLFTWKQLRPFIERFGAIPMTQCATDLNSIRMMKAAAECGRNILLYPEGRTSLDGKQLFYLNPSIGKLVKFLGMPVVVVRTHGVYVTKPRYIKGFRRGRMESKASVLLTKEQISVMKPNEIYEKIKESLIFNDNVWQQGNGIVFKAKELASNLNYILYKCPACGAEYENIASGDTLKCTACGNTVKYTSTGHLVPVGNGKSIDRIDLWVDYERDSITKETENENFRMEKETVAFKRNEDSHEYENAGEGTLFIDKENIGFCGILDGEECTKTLSLKNMPTIVTKNEEGVDLTFDNVTYRFLFKEKKYSMKYGLTVEMMFAKSHNLI